MKVFVAGCGTMGAGIAQVFASFGHETVMFDRSQELVDRGRSMIEKQLRRQLDRGRLTEEAMDALLAKLVGATDLKDAKNSDLVIEAIFEDLEVKRDLFSQLDEICGPDCLFATNTSSLSITDIARGLKHEDRLMGMHFFNPAPVMKLVELIRGEETSEEAMQKAAEIVRAIGKEPVFCRESPGFIVNRLLIPMINEAADLLDRGVASRDDIDQAMRLGANHPMGPLQLADFIGIDIVKNIMEIIEEGTGDPKYKPSPLLGRMVEQGKLGRKSGEGFYTY
ncbi:MAG: 3-hydroxybutyryl-CoA dehydrogenase [Clostridiaceae bacterium]|nr:3-hydroxybutyryl-CoA dehydrogenase [Clostridiaceae bacterium]